MRSNNINKRKYHHFSVSTLSSALQIKSPITIRDLRFQQQQKKNPNNLSSIPALDDSPLSLGSKFIPSPKLLTKTEILQTISRLERDLIIKFHPFNNYTPPTMENPRLKIKSRWMPSELNYTPQQNIIKKSINDIKNRVNKWLPNNPKKLQHDDITIKLNEIFQNGKIKITQSDKNFGLVIFDTIDYHTSIIKMLSDQNIYKKINADEFDALEFLKHKTMKSFNNIKNLFTKHELKFICDGALIDSHYEIPNTSYYAYFHGLPKLHKNKPLPDLPFRPIIAGRPNQLQAKVSRVLTELLLPVIKMYKSILVNSLDLKKRIESKNCLKINFVSIDFVSLYTSIPLSKLYELIQAEIDNPDINPALKTKVIKSLKFIFNNNFFMYNNEYYFQKDGIAMGTPCAPVIANLFLALLFDRHIPRHLNVTHYVRFIDDCFFCYKGDQQHFEEFLLPILINKAMPLEITYEFQTEKINFLDVTIFKKNNKINLKIYQKPLNQYSYIPPSSSHPKSTLKGFIKGEVIRYHRLSTLKEDFTHISNLFYHRLLNVGYTETYLRRLFKETIFKINNPTIMDSTSRTRPFSTVLDEVRFFIRYTNEPMIINEFKKFLEPLAFKIGDSTKLSKINIGNPNILHFVTRSKLTDKQSEFINSHSLTQQQQLDQNPSSSSA